MPVLKKIKYLLHRNIHYIKQRDENIKIVKRFVTSLLLQTRQLLAVSNHNDNNSLIRDNTIFAIDLNKQQ